MNILTRILNRITGVSTAICSVCGNRFAIDPDKLTLMRHDAKRGVRMVCSREACQVYAHFQSVSFLREQARQGTRAKKRRSCEGKNKYKSEASALHYINRLNNPLQYNAYFCKFCCSWHIGHNLTEERKTLIGLKLALEEQGRAKRH